MKRGGGVVHFEKIHKARGGAFTFVLCGAVREDHRRAAQGWHATEMRARVSCKRCLHILAARRRRKR